MATRWRLGLGLALTLVSWLAGSDTAACSAIGCGQTIPTGYIGASGEVDCYTFTAGAGEVVSITVGASVGSGLTPNWRIVKNGTPITDDHGGQGEVQLPESGTYTIEVFGGCCGDDAGGYVLTLEAVSGTFNGASNGAPNPTCERGSDGTQPIMCGDRMPGAIDPAAETDTFTFFRGCATGEQ